MSLKPYSVVSRDPERGPQHEFAWATGDTFEEALGLHAEGVREEFGDDSVWVLGDSIHSTCRHAVRA